MSQIVTLTVNPAVDRSLSTDHVTPNKKLRCSRDRRDPGGGGVNVSRAIHELGGDTLAVFTRGGHMGSIYHDLLERDEISSLDIPIDGATREHIMVHETSTGSIYRFGEPGPELSEDEAEACIAAATDIDPAPDYLVLSGSLPPGAGDDLYARIIRATDPQTRVVIDTTAEAMKLALEEGVFLMKPNARELGEFAGRTLEGEAEIVEVAHDLVHEAGVEVVVTSLGAGGSLLVTEHIETRIAAPAVKVESKVGAGDSMIGGIVLALDRGESVLDAVRFGTATAAAAVMTPMTGLGSRKDAERLYRRMLEFATE